MSYLPENIFIQTIVAVVNLLLLLLLFSAADFND